MKIKVAVTSIKPRKSPSGSLPNIAFAVTMPRNNMRDTKTEKTKIGVNVTLRMNYSYKIV